MNFPIQRSTPIMIFVSGMLIFMVVWPIVMLMMNKENWGSALIGMAICLIVNVPLVWDVFIKKHTVENGVLKYGILNDDIVLSDVRVVRQVGKSLELTTNQYKVHMIAMPRNKEKLLLLIQEANPYVKIDMKA
ncbi:PH domain-containing protein [Bacillus sp. Xin]|uniref:PH domain-containing protein n=1 Tax=unclassified Bacillus (in: firmicutes) TaxID=185979 RepID=UPI0015742FE5|nr:MULTISPECIES: PH domain-containing protein [unclassified Bacillus (in: firmicutes)]MBC6971451.1 PH domain-containing protein [Bacillus sp. Xin]NSW35940.1 PH domain-containing protein [Bacillus sp. Xin1]